MSHRNTTWMRSLIVILFISICSSLYARKAIEVTVGGISQEFTNLDDAFNSLLNPTSYGFASIDNIIGINTFDILGFPIWIEFFGADLQYSFLDKDGNLVQRTFLGSGSRLVAVEQFEDFFTSEAGAAEFARYMKALQAQALYNFVTGPDSTVGYSVRENTIRAMGQTRTRLEQQRSMRDSGIFSIGFERNDFEAGEFSGETYVVPIEFGGNIGSKAHFLFRIPLGYTDLSGTEFYRFGTELDLGFKLKGGGPTSPFTWELTPTVGNFFMGTTDLNIGGDIYNYGLKNRFEASSGPVSVSYGIYYGEYKSAKVSIAGTEVDLEVDDAIISQGLKIVYRIGGHLALDAYIINSRPESGDNYDEVETIGASLVFRTSALALSVGYAEDEGKDTENELYESERLLASLIFRF